MGFNVDDPFCEHPPFGIHAHKATVCITLECVAPLPNDQERETFPGPRIREGASTNVSCRIHGPLLVQSCETLLCTAKERYHAPAPVDDNEPLPLPLTRQLRALHKSRRAHTPQGVNAQETAVRRTVDRNRAAVEHDPNARVPAARVAFTSGEVRRATPVQG